jgi:hypothetical protein
VKLEDFVADKVLKLSPDELSQLTAKYIGNKAEFIRRMPRVSVSHDDGGVALEARRAELLRRLDQALERCGIRMGDLGSDFTGSGLEE